MYTIYRKSGWHGQASDPVIAHTDDEREAAMIAGCRVDIRMPGASSPYSTYAVDELGDRVEPIESYRCAECRQLVEWGDGPIGTKDGRILECPDSLPSHLVEWVCENCANDMLWPGDDGWAD